MNARTSEVARRAAPLSIDNLDLKRLDERNILSGNDELHSAESPSDREALANSERQFSSLLDVLSGVFYRCELTPPWRMDYVSRGVEALTGYRASHFESASWQGIMHPADVPEVDQTVNGAIARRAPFSSTYRIRHRSGEIRWVKEQGQAVFGPDGDALFLEGMITDVSEEQALRQASADSQLTAASYADRLTQVLESTTDCVLCLD